MAFINDDRKNSCDWFIYVHILRRIEDIIFKNKERIFYNKIRFSVKY